MKQALLLLPLALAACGEPKEKTVITMAGDSHMELGQWQELTKKCTIAKVTKGGSTSADILARLDEIKTKQGEQVYLMVGINDLVQGVDISTTVSNVQQIANQVPLKVFPVMHSNRYPEINAKVDALNEEYRKHFTMTYGAVWDPSNSMPDGLHMEQKGYQTWYKVVKGEFKRLGC